MKKFHKLAWILLVVGGLNLLVLGVFQWEIGMLFGVLASRALYVLIGLAAVYELFTHKSNCKNCSAKSGGMPQMGGQGGSQNPSM